MKILKYIFFLLLIVVIGGTIYFSTKDGTYDIKDSKVINAPINLVFNTVNDLKKWEEWGPWKKEDSTMVFYYGDVTEGEGASYSWTGMMDGSMKTTNTIQNKEIKQDLSLITPAGERNPKVYWYFEEVEGGTKITWGMNGEHTLMDKMYYTFSSMNFEADMHIMNNAGLDGIDEVIQNDMKKYVVTVDGMKQHGGGFYMYTTSASKISDIGSKMGPMMGEVAGYMSQNNIVFAGMPFTIYNEINNTNSTVIFSTCIPVNEQIITKDDATVFCGYMAPTYAIKTTLKGNYTNLSFAYEKAEEYIKQNNLLKDPARNMFEIYTTDPGEVPNPANWITEIYIPVFKDLRSNHPIISGNN